MRTGRLTIESFHELQADFAHALAWIRSLGGHTENTRFAVLNDDIDAMVRAFETQDIGKFADNLEHKSGIYSLLEAQDLVRINQAYEQHRDVDALRERLERVSAGPRSGVMEPPTGSADGRNILAELTWGAMLEAGGYETSLGFDPDILQVLPKAGHHPEEAISWEVKRPLGPTGIDGVVRKGRTQIVQAMTGAKDVGGRPLRGGCIVVFLDHVLGRQKVIVTDHPADLQAMLRSASIDWYDKHRRLIHRRAARAGVIGVVLYWRPLAFFKNPDGATIPVGCTQLTIDDTLPTAVEEDHALLRGIIDKIRSPQRP